MSKEVWEKPNPIPKKDRKTLKGKKNYSSVKAQADKKFGKKTSLVKNMYISKRLG